jgi:hypothetical protein
VKQRFASFFTVRKDEQGKSFRLGPPDSYPYVGHASEVVPRYTMTTRRSTPRRRDEWMKKKREVIKISKTATLSSALQISIVVCPAYSSQEEKKEVCYFPSTQMMRRYVYLGARVLGALQQTLGVQSPTELAQRDHILVIGTGRFASPKLLFAVRIANSFPLRREDR